MQHRSILQTLALITPLALIVGCGKDVTVDPPKPKPADSVRVSIDPANGRLFVGESMQFNATVTGASNTSVGWRLLSSAPDYGSISPTGLYTAPASVVGDSIVVTVRAASSVAPEATASATVVVRRLSPRVPKAGSSYTYAYYALDSAGRRADGSERTFTQSIAESGIEWNQKGNVMVVASDAVRTYTHHEANGDMLIWDNAGAWYRYPFGSRGSVLLRDVDSTRPSGASYTDSVTATYLGAEIIKVGEKNLVAYKVRINRLETSGTPEPYTVTYVDNFWYAPEIGWFVKWDYWSVYHNMGSHIAAGGVFTLTGYDLR